MRGISWEEMHVTCEKAKEEKLWLHIVGWGHSPFYFPSIKTLDLVPCDNESTVCKVINFGSLWIFSYSWNEGETWLTYKFLNDTRMYVYGLLTEPSERSAEFTIYGSFRGQHKWVVVQINLRKALGKIHSLTFILHSMLAPSYVFSVSGSVSRSKMCDYCLAFC